MPAGCGPLPLNNNLAQTNVRGNKVFVVGGEVDLCYTVAYNRGRQVPSMYYVCIPAGSRSSSGDSGWVDMGVDNAPTNVAKRSVECMLLGFPIPIVASVQPL